MAIWALLKLKINIAILDCIESEGSEYLREFEADPEKNVMSLEAVEKRILPDIQTKPVPSALRLFRNIFKAARDRNFESSVDVMQSYREEVFEDIFRIQNLQKNALWLGILGTFMGLLVAIASQAGSEISQQKPEDFLMIINKMFDGLYLSFTASIAGLQVALILGFWLLLLRKKHNIYFQNMEQAVLTGMSVARNSENKDSILSSLKDATNEIRETRYQLGQIYHEIDGLQKLIQKQNREIERSLVVIVQRNTDLMDFRTEVANQHQTLINEIAKNLDAIALKSVFETAIIESAGLLDANVSLIADNLSRFNTGIAKLDMLVEESQKFMLQNIAHLETATHSGLAQNARTIMSGLEDLKTRISDARTRYPKKPANVGQRSFAEVIRSWFR